ncbi:histone H3-like centromeric protein A [Parus major]|uniref:histone H3-like centromeric protein A n=1 Tax=Parus major TaxID=9157 RepID=UPI0007710F73|nr:histone H3-like centromeric protein A [Parus major]
MALTNGDSFQTWHLSADEFDPGQDFTGNEREGGAWGNPVVAVLIPLLSGPPDPFQPCQMTGLALTPQWIWPYRSPKAPTDPIQRPPGRHSGQWALQEIRMYQSSTCLLLCPDPFARVVQDLCLLFTRGVDYCWQSMALLALQEAEEAFAVRLLEDMYLCSLHVRRVTLFPKDLQLAQCLWGIEGGGI